MIARYELLVQQRQAQAYIDEDGPWCRFDDVRSHVDRAIHRLIQDDPVACLAALKKIVDREPE